MTRAELPHGDGSRVPPWAHSHKKISVDVDSLTDVRRNLHDELHANFAPNYRQFSGDLQKSEFGQHPAFEEAHFIASVHDDMLQDAQKLVDKYENGLASMSNAAGYMAEEYGDADSLSASHLSKFQAEQAFKPHNEEGSDSGQRPGGTTSGPPPNCPVSPRAEP